MKDLFAYGTLMCQDIMEEVSGLDIPSEPAILLGFRRLKVKGEVYPALLPNTAGSVTGRLYRDIDQAAWARLDRFEGEMYRRETVQVELADGSTAAAETYAFSPDFTACLEDADWDLEHFLCSGKARFRSDYPGYRE